MAEVLRARGTAKKVPKPSDEFRQASWRAFQTALERYDATKQPR
jgi:hypothetical protein